MNATTLQIGGMHCDACVRRVNTAITKVPGVISATVKVGSAEVEFDETKTNPAQIAAAVEKIGFTTVAG